MSGQRKALGDLPRALERHTPRRSGDLVYPHLNTNDTELSNLIDQAQERARLDRLRALFYGRRYRKHRRILIELRKLAEVHTDEHEG